MNILEMLILTIAEIACFLIGYYVGKDRDINENLKSITQTAYKSVKKKTTAVGPVNRPSAAKVIRWSQPDKEEEDKAFKESFIKQIIDHS